MADYQFQLNAKLGKGYDAHLLNVVGSDTEDFKGNLQWVTENAAGIAATLTALEAAYGVKEIAANVTSTSVSNERPQQQQQQTSGAPGPSCKHGAYKLVPGGVSKGTGNSYNAFWACTAPRAEQCKSQNS